MLATATWQPVAAKRKKGSAADDRTPPTLPKRIIRQSETEGDLMTLANEWPFEKFESAP
jgi:hypothetical protein